MWWDWDVAQDASQSRCTPELSPLQALKYECYLDSPLVRFLMKRAICDLKITHYFFWWVWGVPGAALGGNPGARLTPVPLLRAGC